MDIPVETAIWFPFWYEMDQSIFVGEVAGFDFFEEPPDYVVHEGQPVFYHGNWHPKCKQLYNRKTKRILSIRHPKLGLIQSIDTKGLDYKFSMTDGRVLKVEAEESPGLVYELPEPINDWRVFVETESV